MAHRAPARGAHSRFGLYVHGVRVFVLGSGSSGNVTVLESGGARIMVDAGLNPTAAATRMRALGAELMPRAVDAILITHHHGDHIGQADSLVRATKAPLYLHDGVMAVRLRAKMPVNRYDAGALFRIGPFAITACALPHDAPQVALRIEANGVAFVIATDLGHVTAPLVEMLRTADAALVEANHCLDLLAVGPYPLHLKRRVAGALGHLSNEQTGDLAAALRGSRLRALYLGHLSEKNNTPDRAHAAVAPRCPGISVSVVLHGEPRVIDVVGAPPPPQLSLGF